MNKRNGIDFEVATTVTIPIKIKVKGFIPKQHGRLYGPPENCYPDEPAEWDHEEYYITVRTYFNGKLSYCDILLPEEFGLILDDNLDEIISETGENKIYDLYGEEE